jgi:hypothetical protein
MSTTTVAVGGKLQTADHAQQTDTFNLAASSTLDLRQIGSTDTIHFVGRTDIGYGAGPYNATFNLVSVGGSTFVDAGSYGVWTGTINVLNGSLVAGGGSHSHWVSAGHSVIAGKSEVLIQCMTGGGDGTMQVSRGAHLEWSSAYGSIPVTLDGGRLTIDQFFNGPATAQDVTIQGQGRGNVDEIDFQGAVNAASWSMKGDLLQVFNGQGSVIGQINALHNHTGRPLEVCQTATGVAVFADNVQRPDMIAGQIS